MGRKLLQIFVVVLLIIILPSFHKPRRGSVTVHITNLRSNKGAVLIAVYDSADKFPKDAAKYAIGKNKAAIRNLSATATFPDLPYGKLAIAILHDENDNMKMDFNIIGMPKEGYGFSNNAKGNFGPPDFSKAAFSLDAPDKEVSVKTTYFFK